MLLPPSRKIYTPFLQSRSPPGRANLTQISTVRAFAGRSAGASGIET